MLVARYSDLTSVSSIHDALCRRIVELEAESESARRVMAENGNDQRGGDGSKGDISPKDMLKALNRTIKVMRKCRGDIGKLLGDSGPDVHPSPALLA